MTTRILVGDCRDMLRTLPDESVHCVVTSPPYWGLRDYGVIGQLGLERTLGEHVETMRDVFLEVRRVLRSDGTLWLNYGDSYATSVNGRSAADTKAAGNDDRTFRDKPFSTIGPIYDPNHRPNGTNRSRGRNSGTKQVGNETVPLGRIVSGGTLKPKDLCGIPWRVAFALQESGWWLRQDIIWSKPNPMPESIKDRCTKAHEYLFLLSKSERYFFDADAIKEDAVGTEAGDIDGGPQRLIDGSNANDGRNYRKVKMPDGWDTGPGGHGSHHRNGREKGKTRKVELANGFRGGSYVGGEPGPRTTIGNNYAPDSFKRNKRSVWAVATAPFSEAHFATFPPALIEPCILAGCPKGGMVLDPFGGAGTTGLVADRLGRNSILIELNPEYAEMARERVRGDGPLFAEVS